MDTAHWPQQGIGVVESSQRQAQSQVERSRARPHKEHALNCPRCNSTNTKFCYYNNYSLTQPRYFCKTCRRYWTEGGSLRNVPVGGGSRKNKKSSFSSSSSNSAPTPTIPSSSSTNPQPLHQHMIPGVGNDLNLSFSSARDSVSALELLRMGTFVPGSVFGFQEMMRPVSDGMKLHPLDGVGGSMQGEGDGRLLFPFEDLKQVSMSNGALDGVVQGQGDPTLFWNGVMGSGGSGGGGGGGGGSW